MSPNSPPTETSRAVLLADPTRQRICEILTTADPPRTERDLAVELAACSRDLPPRAVTAEQRRHQQIRLHHHQLPKLDDYGLVRYNRSRRTVSITAAGRETLAEISDTPVASPA